jgi:lipopolysaccharide export system protein LptA
VLVAYFIYARVAVPHIEPSIAGPSGAIVDAGSYEPSDDQRIKQLEALFPPGTLDLKKSKVLENDKVILLLEDYDNTLGDGRVKLKPCTMVYLWDGQADDEAQRLRQSIILEAKQGAILKFDKPIDLSSLRIGRLVGGSLLGPITIRSQGKSPGPEDDLLIHTSEVQLDEQTVWTHNPVEFTWGRNSGRGRDMRIKLRTDPSKVGNDKNVPPYTGIELFEMQHIDSLHLEKSPAAPNRTSGPMSAAAIADSPVEITCNGPFTFNNDKHVATFAKDVNVFRMNPNGPSDQIQAELLSIYFVPRDNSKPNSDNSSDLEPERIEALGHPVIITAPTKNLNGQGERLEYNIKTNVISLDGGPEVFLHQGPNEIHARSLQYQWQDPNRLGLAASQGPGWFRGQIDENPEHRFEARWNDKLYLLQPKDQYHKISLTGGSILDYPGIGRLEAGEISFWLKETPGGPANQPRMHPDYMNAQNHVILSSPQLTAAVEQQMEVWFEQKDPLQGIPSKTDGNTKSPLSMPANQGQALPPQADTVRQRFKVAGRALQAHIQLYEGKSPVLDDIMIEDNVCLEEIQTLQPNDKPILIQGDRLHGTNISPKTAVVTVTGRPDHPAHFEGPSLGLTGLNINLNLATNHLSIDGPGRMDLPLSNKMMGQSLVPGQSIIMSGTLLIDWQKKMDFDGRTAKFEESVSATTAQLHVQTKTLEVQLKSPISFSDPNLQNQDQNGVENLLCQGGVSLENKTLDSQQQLTSYDRMQVTDLAVNMQSGALTAGGPGWLNRVNLGSMNPKQNQLGTGFLVGRPAVSMANNNTATPSQLNNQLYCLHVRFQDSIRGNLRQGELEFRGQIRAAYGPVFDWNAMIDPDNQNSLGPNGITLNCNSLKVNQMPLPTGKGQYREVVASGNAVAEGGGGVFNARAARIIYTEDKDLLTLEGDGRTYAELYQQPQPGAPFSTTAAQKFEYNLKTKAIKINNARSLDITPGKN